MRKKTFQKLHDEIYNSIANSIFKKLLDNSLVEDAPFFDTYQTREQKKRDASISVLLNDYVDAYKNKTTTQKAYRKALFITSSVLLSLFSIAVIIIGVVIVLHKSKVEVNNLISLITLCITYLASLVGLIQIITKFCFPENDEQYITQIVESIQRNDLDNKKENMHFRQDNVKEGQGPEK